MAFIGYKIEQWINIFIQGIIAWAIIIPSFILIRWINPSISMTAQLIIGFFLAMIVSVMVSRMTAGWNAGSRIKEKYDKFLNKINSKIWGESNEREKKQ
jgi:hypothetical protein